LCICEREKRETEGGEADIERREGGRFRGLTADVRVDRLVGILGDPSSEDAGTIRPIVGVLSLKRSDRSARERRKKRRVRGLSFQVH